MAKYVCKNCGMKTIDLKCNKCNKTFQESFLKKSGGMQLRIIICRDGYQRLKSPICSSKDMVTYH